MWSEAKCHRPQYNYSKLWHLTRLPYIIWSKLFQSIKHNFACLIMLWYRIFYRHLTQRDNVMAHCIWYPARKIETPYHTYLDTKQKVKMLHDWPSVRRNFHVTEFSMSRIHWQRVYPGNRPKLLWRHNEHGGVSVHQPCDCLLNRLFRRRSKKTSKLRVTSLCVGNSPVTDDFPPPPPPPPTRGQ